MLTLTCVLALAPSLGAHAAPTPTDRVAVRIDEVDDLVATGRLALDEGRLDDAELAFEQAAAKDAERGAIWQMRALLSRGSVDDVLARLSSLRRKGKEGGDYTYLWGIAFATQVEFDLATGNTNNAGLLIKDARRELETVCTADPVRYRDAHLYLARICRHDGDHAASVAAAKRAVEHYPNSIEARELIGRGALAQYAAVLADTARAAEAEALMAEAVAAFSQALELLGRPRGGGEQALAATLHTQLGDAHAFAQRKPDAIAAYAEAIGWEPAGFDYGRAFNVLGIDDFVKCIDAGRAHFAKRSSAGDARMATVEWWRGYALFAQKDPARNEEAEKAFAEAMRLWPAYANGWYYTARLRYDRQDRAGALVALHEMSTRARPELIALVQYDPTDVNRLFGVIEHCMAQNPPQLEEAAFLTEIQVEAFPEQHTYWNNLGLFWRDAADLHVGRKGRTGMNDEERARFMPMYERSFEAYLKALDLDPGNPAYLNDGAVILHFYLERDYDRALSMYADATRRAQELLDAGTLSGEELSVVQIALRDSKNNRRDLERKIENEKRREEERRKKEQEGGGSGSGS